MLVENLNRSLYAVVMAGGRGTRFWPRSRMKRPKQLLDIVGSKTMLEQTIDRILPLCDWDHILVVTEASQADQVAAALPELPASRLIVEPLGKNTAPCIGLAALLLEAVDPQAVMVVLPADHSIGDPSRFRETLTAAVLAASDGEHLITLGIPPSAPETGYGYLEQGEKVKECQGRTVWKVKAFHEKPDRKRAEIMVRSGRYYWNSGMFIWTVSAILDQMARLTPALFQELSQLRAHLNQPDWGQALLQTYQAVENISIDYAVMEKADKVWMLAGDFGWNDVGSWEAVYQLSPKEDQGNSLNGPVVVIDSRGCLVHSPKKTVALIGMTDVIVVETDDALLICPRERAQEVKKIVETLEAQGKTELL